MPTPAYTYRVEGNAMTITRTDDGVTRTLNNTDAYNVRNVAVCCPVDFTAYLRLIFNAQATVPAYLATDPEYTYRLWQTTLTIVRRDGQARSFCTVETMRLLERLENKSPKMMAHVLRSAFEARVRAENRAHAKVSAARRPTRRSSYRDPEREDFHADGF